MGDVDIFGDDRADGNVRTRDQLIGPGAEDRAHWAVEPIEAPAGGEAFGDQAVDLLAAGVGASDDIVEEIALGVVIARVLDGRSQPMLVELMKQSGQRRALHLLLVERLDRREAGRGARTGTGTGTGFGHWAGAVAAGWRTRKG